MPLQLSTICNVVWSGAASGRKEELLLHHTTPGQVERLLPQMPLPLF